MIRSVFFCAAVMGAVLSAPVSAATFSFDMTVVSSVDDAPRFDLPDVGSAGRIEFTIDGAALDALPDVGIDINLPLPTSLLSASAKFVGAQTLEASLEIPTVLSRSPSEGISIRNGSFGGLPISLTGTDCVSLSCTLVGAFTVSAPGAPEVFSYTDVEALLANPDLQPVFSLGGTVADQSVSFRAELAPIPVPASGLLLLGGLLMAGTVARRRKYG